MAACGRCGSADLVRISLSPQGRVMTFLACRACEHRWWSNDQAAQPVPLDRVLEHLGR